MNQVSHRLIITNATIVLPNRVMVDGNVVCEDGYISDITQARVTGSSPDIVVDARGALCLPGLVDTHSDGLERERFPRPGVDLGAQFSVRSFEGRVRASGITTMFHGIGLQHQQADDQIQRHAEGRQQQIAESDQAEFPAGGRPTLPVHPLQHQQEVQRNPQGDAGAEQADGGSPAGQAGRP